jgi:hypothetical protein
MRRGKSATGAKPEGGEEKQEPAPAPNPYENSIKSITAVSTVEGFWEVYNWLTRPNDLPNTTDYHFFRDGIKRAYIPLACADELL